jgi:signal transduction histidine kinase
MQPLRRRLFILAAAAILPLALMTGIALLTLVNQQRALGERTAIELARALASGVDSELSSSIDVLQALATSLALDNRDLRGFDQRARRVLATQPNWAAVNLADPSGKPLVNTRMEIGSRLPELIETRSFQRVVETRAPVVGNLAQGPGGRLFFPVRVPVMRDGELRYVLSAVVRPEAILQVVMHQRAPEDWVISVFDAANQRVARSRVHAEHIGGMPAPSLRKLMASPASEGFGETYALEGDRVYTAYHRLANGWTIAPGVPASAVEGSALRFAAIYGSGIVLSIVLGFLAALHIARGINSPMAGLSAAAQALGRRESIAPPRTDIREIRQVADSLAVAADERARGEAERDALLEREQEARAAAEAANRAKDEFLALLGHELRNPLGAIMNATRLLDHPGIAAEDAARARGIIGRQAEHLARLTDDLLDAGRAIMGKIVLELRAVDLAAAVAQALATLRSGGRLGQHRVVEDLQPAWLQADATRLEQIIANLVVNAVKYTPLGGTISLTVRKEGGDAVLRVVDNGIGMRGELLSRVFEPFVQGEPGLDRSAGGLGLGLTLVRQLAALHGGSASASSDGPGHGSAFTVRFPAIEPRPQPRRAARTGAPAPGRDILIVEDNADARETLRRLLELQGHRVRVAAEGTSALETLRTAPPEVALVDIGLPGIDGYEIARRVRAGGGPRILLIALTGYGLTEDRRRTAEAGFDLHLVKPVDYEKLNEALR